MIEQVPYEFATDVVLHRQDAALIFRTDGTYELHYPQQAPDAEVSTPMFKGAVCLTMLSNEQLRDATIAVMTALRDDNERKEPGH